MPEWIVMLGLAIVAWLALTVVGGMLVGRVVGLASRRLSLRRRRAA